ncbi:membrane protein [soil metagenome]
MTDPTLTPAQEGETLERKFGRQAPGTLFVGVIAFLIFLIGSFIASGPARDALLGSYMFGWVFWMTITFSMFALTLLHHVIRGQWTLSIIRFLEAGGGAWAFLAMAVLFLPILWNLGSIYEWAHPEAVAKDHVLQWKSVYLNQPGFISRFIIFVGSWAAIAWGMKNSVKKQERTGEFKYEAGRMSWGAISLVYFVVSVTFAMTDWVMSMEAHWSSTMYALWTLMGGVGGALALGILLLCQNANKAPFKSVVFPGLTRDLGNMLFTLTMLWGYTCISQFLIIWNGNIPETASYYARRGYAMHPPGMEANNWGALGLLLIVGRFFIPWFWLLSPRTKRTPQALMRVCGWVLVMHLLDVYMLVVPATPGRVTLGPVQFPQNLVDIGAVIGIGCLWWGVFATQLGKFPLLARYDTRLQEAKAHAH